MIRRINMLAVIAFMFVLIGLMPVEGVNPPGEPVSKPLVKKAQIQEIITHISKGEIVSVDVAASELVVKIGTKEPKDISFILPPKIIIDKAGKRIDGSELSEGDKVLVAYLIDEKSDKKIVGKINVITPRGVSRKKAVKKSNPIK